MRKFRQKFLTISILFYIGFTLLLSLLAFYLFPITLYNSIKKSEKENLLEIQKLIESSYHLSFDQVLDSLHELNIRVVINDKSGTIIVDNNPQSSALNSLLLTDKSESVFSAKLQNRAFVSTLSFQAHYRNYHSVILLKESSEMYISFRDSCINCILSLAIIDLIALLVILIVDIKYYRSVKDLSDEIECLYTGQTTSVKKLPLKDLDNLYAQLNDFIVQQKKLNALRDRFVSDASHELKTPLASVKLLSETILYTDNITMDQTRDFLSDINQEIDRLTRICSKLLMITKFDTLYQKNTDAITDVKKVITDVKKILSKTSEESNLMIRAELADNCFVRAEYDVIYQICFNLIENALKYGQNGKEIRVFLYSKEDEITIIVDDDGEGIPESDIEKIFDRFYRVDKARARATGGSGLGLSIVDSAVKSCGGTVSASNRIPTGARFTVILPQANSLVNPENK